jgi:hypothetical protein
MKDTRCGVLDLQFRFKPLNGESVGACNYSSSSFVGVQISSRELRACPDPGSGPGLNFLFFSGEGPGPGPKIFFVGRGSIFSFNQIHFDFSLKSKYNGAKVNV